MNRTIVLAATASAALGAAVIARHYYREQQAERRLLVARCRLVEEKLSALEFAVSAQARALVTAASYPPCIMRPQGDTPPWLS
jgi:hypothetical protein